MNKQICAWTLITTSTLLAGPAIAQTAFAKMQPGLWETTMTMKTASGEMEAKMAQMQQQMASMPPEQRKMIEDMMAKQGVGVGGRGNTIKMCITAEQAARTEMPASQEGNCQQEVTQRNGSTVRYRFNCTGERPTSGEGEYTMTSPTAYNGRSTVLTQVKGQPEKVEMTHAGRWLGNDCGNIKPLKLNKP